MKHAEFPSVPEAQNMHRVKYAERVRTLDAQIQKLEEEIPGMIDSVAQAMLAQREESESKAAAAGISLQQRETIKKQQADISELKTKVRKMEADRARDRSELEADFSKQLAEAKQQNEEAIKLMKKEMMKELKAMKSLKEDVAGEMREEMGQVAKRMKKEVGETVGADVKDQLRAMRGELEQRQAEQEISQENGLRLQLSTHKEELTKSVQEQLSAHQSSSEIASSTAASVLIQQESSARQADISGLESRMDQATATIHDSIASYRRRLEEQHRKLEEHESKLSNLDTDALEGVAETMSIDFPNLQRKVAGIQAKVDAIPQETDAKQQALVDGVRLYMKGVEDLSHMVDDAERTRMNHEGRIQALERGSASGAGPVPAPGPATSELDGLDVKLFKSDLDSTKAAVDQLGQKVSTSTEDVEGQLMMIRHSITSLESRFNNLTTKSMAEYIIGHLERLYPNSPQLVADCDSLKTLTKSLASRTGVLEEWVQAFKATVERTAETQFNSSQVSNMQEHLMRNVDESNRISHKRKRTGSSPNGTERRLPSNGTN